MGDSDSNSESTFLLNPIALVLMGCSIGKIKSDIPFILWMRLLISSEQASQCMWTFRTVTIGGCAEGKDKHRYNYKVKQIASSSECRMKQTSCTFSSSLGFGFSSSGTFSSGGFGIGERSSTFLWLFLCILSKTFRGSAFSPLITTLWDLQSVSTSSTPKLKHTRVGSDMMPRIKRGCCVKKSGTHLGILWGSDEPSERNPRNAWTLWAQSRAVAVAVEESLLVFSPLLVFPLFLPSSPLVSSRLLLASSPPPWVPPVSFPPTAQKKQKIRTGTKIIIEVSSFMCVKHIRVNRKRKVEKGY